MHLRPPEYDNIYIIVSCAVCTLCTYAKSACLKEEGIAMLAPRLARLEIVVFRSCFEGRKFLSPANSSTRRSGMKKRGMSPKEYISLSHFFSEENTFTTQVALLCSIVWCAGWAGCGFTLWTSWCSNFSQKSLACASLKNAALLIYLDSILPLLLMFLAALMLRFSLFSIRFLCNLSERHLTFGRERLDIRDSTSLTLLISVLWGFCHCDWALSSLLIEICSCCWFTNWLVLIWYLGVGLFKCLIWG